MVPLPAVVALLAAAAVNAAPLHSAAQNGSDHCQRTQVLILGAGMAGISAGNTLTKNGIHDFKIIEYQDRVGGRTLHSNFGSKPDGSAWTVELGTNWITGLHSPNGSTPGQGRFNPVWGLAQAVNLTTVSDDAAADPLYYNSKGEYNWSNYSDAYSAADDRMSDLAVQYIEQGKQDVSVRVGLGLAGWDSTNDMYKQAAEWVSFETDGAAPIDLSSMIFSAIGGAASEGPVLGEYERFVLDQRGYDLVIRHLASEYLQQPTDARLVLSSPVTEVQYSNDSVVVHTGHDGACYRADYAICTFSLGVLQQAIDGEAPVAFRPAFPEWKKVSVLSNVMGIYTKLFYQFKPEDVWWPKEVQTFFYASPDTKGYWGLWESLDFPGSPLEGSGIIFATMTFEQSKRVEQQPDEDTRDEGLEVLRQMFPNVTIPEPEAFLYHKWGMTPWAYGSYSNWAVDYSLEEHTNFRANLGRLWFAGEATSAEYWGYLHGAYFEGELAGEEVAACAKGNRTCADRKRNPVSRGDPPSYYNSTNGFQDTLDQLFG